MMSRCRRAIGVVQPVHVVTALSVAVIATCHREAPPTTESNAAPTRSEVIVSLAAQQEGLIETRPATVTTEPETLRVPGRIVLADNRTWRVGVRADGIVVAVYAGLGDHVRQGQVLARYQAGAVRDARAKYHAAQAELVRAQAAAALAQRNLDRAGRLLELKAASQQQVDQARQDSVAAQSEVRSAQSEVDRLKHLLEKDLRVDAELSPDAETTDEVRIIAPASGYILEKSVTQGKAIDTMDDTFVIGDLSQVWMLASVRQEQMAALRVGQSARVIVPGVAGQEFEGRLTNLGQALDPQTRTMQVRIVLANSGNHLRPEMLGTAEIPAGPRREAVLVPSDALQQVDGQDVIFVRTAPDRFSLRPVDAAETRNGKTRIVKGLTAGEQIVVKGSFVLKSELLKASIEEPE